MKITRSLRSNAAAAIISGLMALAIGAPQPAFAATDNGTLTVGSVTLPFGTCGTTTQKGFSSGASFGSYSPTGLTGGRTVVHLVDSISCSGVSILQVSGFSSDPGSSWLTSITCNGVTRAPPPNAYSYGSGSAQWVWYATFGFLSMTDGTNVSCTIVHN